VRDNPAFARPFGEFLAGLFSRDYFAFVQERTYQPLVTLFHWFTHGAPLAYRLAGLALHAANAALVYAIARRLLKRDRAALLAAALFAFFPAHTEALNFSAFKGHALAAAFIMATVLAFMEKRAAAAAGFFALALLSKETGLVALLLCAAHERGKLRRLAPLAAIGAAYLALRFVWLAPPPAFPSGFARPVVESFGFYVRMLALPWPLCLERTLPAAPLLYAWAAVFVLGVWAWRRSREALFFLAWIVAGLLPVLHLIPFANVTPVADRYLYLPAAGFALLLAGLYGKTARGERLLAGVLVAWASLTAARNLDYRSERALFEQTADRAPDNPRAQFLVANARFHDKDYAAARRGYERVLALTESPGARAALAELDRLEKKP
jgi:hypothetical protein